MKPILARLATVDKKWLLRAQLRVSATPCPDTAGLDLNYRVVGQVPGHVFGTLNDAQKPVVLWLHGGAFILPAAPEKHLVMLARICKELDADGFVPDYRLAPAKPFPAALDDCERAYRALLDLGHAPSRILLGGDSSGGNLALGVLQRIGKAGLPMPSCAVLMSPVTEMGGAHGLPSRARLAKQDPLLSVPALQHLYELYCVGQDAANPEISPLYMDCSGLPPLLFIASDNEILMDDTVLMAGRAHAAGVPTTCHIWPQLPHAFLLFESLFPEGAEARQDIIAFAQQHWRTHAPSP